MGRPIVQISLKDFDVRKKEIASELWRAATEIGFFYLKDHELSAVRACTFQCTQSFDYAYAYTGCREATLHGVAAHDDLVQAEMEHMLSLSEAFFSLPADKKAEYKFDLVCTLVLCQKLCFL